MVPFVASPKRLQYRTARLVKKLGASGASALLANEGIKVSPTTASVWAKKYGITLKKGRRPKLQTA